MQDFVFNPLYNKVPTGAAPVGTNITYNLKVAKHLQVSNIVFVCFIENENSVSLPLKITEEEENYFVYSVSYKFNSAGLFWYYFKVETADQTYCLEKSELFEAVKTSNVNYPFLQLVYNEETLPSNNFSKGIIYHIFVDRFNKSGNAVARDGLILREDWGGEIVREVEGSAVVNRHCFGGDLYGIIEKLPYLKCLNVSTIYLSPIFEAQSNHKYDTSDYSKIDEMFGGDKALQKLINQSKKYDIEIILDGVFNHTGSDSVYFNSENRYDSLGAFQSKDSPYYNWYFFNNFPNDYACWWNIKTLPETNDKEPTYLQYICGKDGIINKYMKMGIGGFRLDVVDELSCEFLDQISAAIKKVKPNALVVGEVWEDASSKIAYSKRRRYFLGGQLNSVTNYPLKNGIAEFVKYGNLKPLIIALYTILEQYPKHVQNNNMNFLNSHDTARILSVLGMENYNLHANNYTNYKLNENELKNAIYLLKMASLIQYTVMGIPTLFYGDEVGMQGLKDPFCRGCFPWGNENEDLLNWYKQLGKLRENSALFNGDFKFIETNYNVLAYERENEENKVVVAVNKSDYEYEIKLPKTMTNFFTKEKSDIIKTYPNTFAVFVNNN